MKQQKMVMFVVFCLRYGRRQSHVLREREREKEKGSDSSAVASTSTDKSPVTPTEPIYCTVKDDLNKSLTPTPSTPTATTPTSK